MALTAFGRADLALAAADPIVPEREQDPRSTQAVSKELDSPRDYSRFGFSLGMGLLGVTGNRGELWQTSRPMYDVAVYYWATPQLSIDIEGYTADSFYETSVDNGGHVDVSIKHFEFAARYYADLRSIVPQLPVGWISPFAAAGAGFYIMQKSSFSQSASEPADAQIGMTLGAGLKFEVIPRTLALELLGRWNSVNFQDTHSSNFEASNGVSDLSGQFISWNANLLVTF